MLSESDGQAGYIDTNVFVHAFANDALSDECTSFLEAVRAGDIRVRLHPFIVYELTYALPRYVKQMKKRDVGDFILSVLA